MPSFKAIYDQAQACLDIFDAHRVRLLLEVSEFWLPELGPFLASHLDVGDYFLPTVVQVMVIVRIEYPILHIVIGFYGQKC